jgi:hypothetical protein
MGGASSNASCISLRIGPSRSLAQPSEATVEIAQLIFDNLNISSLFTKVNLAKSRYSFSDVMSPGGSRLKGGSHPVQSAIMTKAGLIKSIVLRNLSQVKP